MKIKDIIEKFLFLISVPKCVGCKIRLEKPGSPLCPDCTKEYENVKQLDCSLCAQKLDHCTCSNKYLEAHYVKNIVKVYRYKHGDETPSNNLIYSLKRDNRKDVVDFLSNELLLSFKNSYSDMSGFIFTNVPRRSEAIRKYGIDHAAVLAENLANKCGCEYVPLLKSKAKAQQKKLLSHERIKNAKFEYRRNLPNIKGRNIVLIDDIVTTGASMGACAMLIRGLRPKKIIGAAVSIAYKDKYIKFETTDRYKRGKKK